LRIGGSRSLGASGFHPLKIRLAGGSPSFPLYD
jgi:hypothetical protein